MKYTILILKDRNPEFTTGLFDTRKEAKMKARRIVEKEFHRMQAELPGGMNYTYEVNPPLVHVFGEILFEAVVLENR